MVDRKRVVQPLRNDQLQGKDARRALRPTILRPVAAALRLANELGPDAQVATILCDRAERYYSTRLFTD